MVEREKGPQTPSIPVVTGPALRTQAGAQRVRTLTPPAKKAADPG